MIINIGWIIVKILNWFESENIEELSVEIVCTRDSTPSEIRYDYNNYYQ